MPSVWASSWIRSTHGDATRGGSHVQFLESRIETESERRARLFSVWGT
jgi:hypothetical protein